MMGLDSTYDKAFIDIITTQMQATILLRNIAISCQFHCLKTYSDTRGYYQQLAYVHFPNRTGIHYLFLNLLISLRSSQQRCKPQHQINKHLRSIMNPYFYWLHCHLHIFHFITYLNQNAMIFISHGVFNSLHLHTWSMTCCLSFMNLSLWRCPYHKLTTSAALITRSTWVV